MEGDVILADVATEIGVVNDDEERRDGNQDQQKDLQEFAEDVAIEDVWEGDVQAGKECRLFFERPGGDTGLLATA